MTNFGQNIHCKTLSASNEIKTNDLYSTGEIHWTSFDPPIIGGGIGGLAATLNVSNDANTLNIVDVKDLGVLGLTTTDGLQVREALVTGDLELQVATTFNAPGTSTFNTIHATNVEELKKLSLESGGAAVADHSILEFISPAGTLGFQTFINGDTRVELGAAVGTKCSNLVMENCNFDSATNTFPASIDDDTLESVMDRGNTANVALNMNTNNILAAGVISTVSLNSTSQIVGNVVLCKSIAVLSDATVTSGEINYNVGTGGQEIECKFSGNSGNTFQDTKLTGDGRLNAGGQPVRTKVTNMDLSDQSNIFQTTDRELYEWGAYIQPSTYQEVLQLTSSPLQIFGTDVYAFTAATTNPDHARQKISVGFNVVEYGWENINIGLRITDENGTNPADYTSRSFVTLVDGKGVQLTSRQKVGFCTMDFFIEDSRFHDGARHRIYPYLITAAFTADPGKVRIAWGPGIDHNGSQALAIGAVIINGGPCPSEFRVVTA